MTVPSTAPVSEKRLLFFSGGTALRATARFLARVAPRTAYLITPFDSGGSSAAIRRGFAMPAVGDIRNRLMAMAASTGNCALAELFAHRLPKTGDQAELRRELGQLADGSHPLLRPVPEPEREVVLERLHQFRDRMPRDFDLRGASVGNMMLTAGYLAAGRDLVPAIDHFAGLIRARGTVRPVTDRDLHLAVRLEDGRIVTGQHNITGKETEPLTSPVRDIWLTDAVDDPAPAKATDIPEEVRELIAGADLICFPMGSFYSSVVANLLPRGVGRAVAANPCPKIFVPSTGYDPEAADLGVARRAGLLRQYLAADGPPPGSRLLDTVVADPDADYPGGLDTPSLRAMGLKVVERSLLDRAGTGHLDGERLGELLLSLA